MTVLVLPFLDALARDLVRAEEGLAVDFSRPAGEAALVPPDSVSWRIFRNPVALFVGGVAAVILELADPAVRTGVWEHTSFRGDPVTRLRRTGLAAMVTVYGPRRTAEAMIARIGRRHEAVRGRTPAGEAYTASDPALLVWVHATASFGFAEAYDRYVRPLGGEGFDRFYAEGRTSARLYGAVGAPLSRAAVAALIDGERERLEASPIVFEFLDIMRRAPVFPAPLRPLQRLMIRAAVDLVPAWVRDRLGLGPALGLRPWQRPLVRAAGALADRVMLPSSPAVQSCLRLGLPADYLYR
ncbi:MAG: DUF2236 domain-containing protein [Proteobacteria bacterium]|nr:DUF2236 domain-containing protein [Pseudomonadota bacterium]